jgi:hypothetical protein
LGLVACFEQLKNSQQKRVGRRAFQRLPGVVCAGVRCLGNGNVIGGRAFPVIRLIDGCIVGLGSGGIIGLLKVA